VEKGGSRAVAGIVRPEGRRKRSGVKDREKELFEEIGRLKMELNGLKKSCQLSVESVAHD